MIAVKRVKYELSIEKCSDIPPGWLQSRPGSVFWFHAETSLSSDHRERKSRTTEQEYRPIICCLRNIFYLYDNHCLTEYMYDYYNYPQMFDEPSEYQDETSRAYDRAETLYYVSQTN